MRHQLFLPARRRDVVIPLAVDAALVLGMHAGGANVAAASIVGFVIASLFTLGLRIRSRTRAHSAADGRVTGAVVTRYFAIFIFALGLRGGAMATSMACGLP